MIRLMAGYYKQMKQIAFISKKEVLSDTLFNLNPKFESLLSQLSPAIQSRLSLADKAYCSDSFLLKNQILIEIQQEEPPKSIQQLLEWIVIELLGRTTKPYVQCLGQEVKDFKLKTRNLNFGRTIIQTSPTFRTLFSFCYLLVNYIIIVPYKGEYIQVAGKMLNQRYNMKAVGSKKFTYQPTPTNQQQVRESNSHSHQPAQQKQKSPPKQQKPANFKSFAYSSYPIHRFQIFYCSDMNRATGLFSRNIFFDKGLKKSIYIHETQRLMRKCLQEHFKGKITLNEKQVGLLTPILLDLFQSMRDLMNVRMYLGKHTSRFNMLLARHCRLSTNYYSLKRRVGDYQRGQKTDANALFDALYAEYSDYNHVKELIVSVLRSTIPQSLLGLKNKLILLQMMDSFISMKRFQNYKMQDFLLRMDAFQPPWIAYGFNHKHYRKILTRRRRLLALTVGFVINEIVVPLIKLNYYVTQKHKQANRIFYYRKPIWTLISKTALKRFSEQNLQRLDQQQVMNIKKSMNDIYPQGKLRILPKKGTFRPIITFNRKIQFTSDPIHKNKLRANLNQILADTQLVLRNLKNILGQKFGYCIFDNRQISKKYDAYVKKWRDSGSPPLKYFTVDIHKCYDSIDTSRLLRFIEESEYIDDLYLVIKYNRLYRNKKAILGNSGSFTSYFNYKQRTSAVPLKQDPMQLNEEHSVPAINIFPGRQRIITKEAIIQRLRRICSGSIVNYRKLSWLQKLGIPQGLNVSGVLCSLYFACLEDQYVKVKDGLLMRLTDDYFYIGPEKEAVKVLDSLLHCAQKNGFRFSEDKISKNFDHPVSPKINNSKEIVWIGKRINVETLQMIPNFQLNDRVGYAMNVNLDRNQLKRFLKNKLKSLLTNHFAAYFKPQLFDYPHLAENVRLYVRMSLEKFFPFLQQLIRQDLENVPQLIIKILKSCIHEFLVFACMLAQQMKDKSFYHQLYGEVRDEITIFFTRKSSHPYFRSIANIYRSEGGQAMERSGQ